MSESFALNLIDYFEWILDKEGTLIYEEELTKDYYKEVKKIQENTFDVVYITLNYVKHLSKNISKEDKELELYKKYIYDNIEGVAKELKAMDDERGKKRI